MDCLELNPVLQDEKRALSIHWFECSLFADTSGDVTVRNAAVSGAEARSKSLNALPVCCAVVAV
jgi:hypothetical protein